MTIDSKRELLIKLLRENAHQDVAVPAPEETPLTRREADELGKLARQQAKLKKRDLAARKTHLVADAERLLATQFSADDGRWRDFVKDMSQRAATFNEQMAALARDSGFPPSFAPSIAIGWFSRGENASRERRAELRRVMQSRYDAQQQAAELEVERELTHYLERLTKESLSSTRAQQLLSAMKPLTELLPPIDLAELRTPPVENFFRSWDKPPPALTAATLQTLTDERQDDASTH